MLKFAMHLVVMPVSLDAGRLIGFALIFAFLSFYLGPFLIRIIIPFRGLLVPLLPRNPHVKFRVALRISSYLPRWRGAVTFFGAWSIGLALAYGAKTLLYYTRNGLAASAIFIPVVYAIIARPFYINVLKKEQERMQRQRDRRAAEIVAMVRDKSLGSDHFSLWLRPFNSTGRCWVIARSRKYKSKSESPGKEGWSLEFTDLETVLAAVMEAIAPLIALGASGEQIGAGRADIPEASWQETFRLLTKSSYAIFLLPSLQSGTQWELKFLLSERERLRRVIFILPPSGLDRWQKIRMTENWAGSKKLTYDLDAPTGYRYKAEEISTARDEALRAFERILQPDDYREVCNAADGALIQLSANPRPEIIAMAKLRTAYATFPLYLNWGPRFVQPQFRKQVLGMLSGWSSEVAGDEPRR